MDSLVLGGRLISLHEPLIMGVINITPDSFYKNSRFSDLGRIVERVGEMIIEGADIIDFGAFSSRPGADMISVEEELDRLGPSMEEVFKVYPDINISLDTYRSEVLNPLFSLGSFIINDITAFSLDAKVLDFAVQHNLPYVLMHMKGLPINMQDDPSYTDVCLEVINFMALKLHQIKSRDHHQVIIDPGFGFGKSIAHNYQLLGGLNAFKIFDLPLMVGISRKSMICKTLEISPEQALNGTTALHMIALQNGAKILRVHDVKEARECVSLWNLLQAAVK